MENLIKGLYLTLKKQERIADIQEIFNLVHTALRVMIGEVGGEGGPPTGECVIFTGFRVVRTPGTPGINLEFQWHR